jgi:phosphonoacetaldehyde hydrolase
MALQCMMDLGVYPAEAIVKIGDTVPDIQEGLNAGMWTIGVIKTGNEFGLSEKQVAALDAETLNAKREQALARLAQAGAHYVVDSLADCDAIIDDIDARLAHGERP